MNTQLNSPECERSSDLMAFLYNEMEERETRAFERHLHTCSNCREQLASFGAVRESIGAYRDEALRGFVPSTATPPRRSAVAALRQFFDLSPLWLKGAAAFAVLTFCVLVALLFINFKKEPSVALNSDKVYSQQDVDRMIDEALAQQPVKRTPHVVVAVDPPKQQQKPQPRQIRTNRRPLSRAEREQLAADLRLVANDDGLTLLGDRINQ